MTDNHDLHDERISRLYKQGNQAEPSADLDRQIIQAAREAVPKRKQRFIWPSLATAAVLVLSLSLVLKVLEQQPLEESVMSPVPSKTEGRVMAPTEEKELQEKAASPVDEKDNAKSPVPPGAPTQTRPSTIAPDMMDIAPLKKSKPKLEPAPAVEIYRSPAAPAEAVAPDAGKIQSFGSSRTQSAPSIDNRIEQELKQQKQRKRFDLQAVPETMLRAPARKKKQDLCADIVMPGSDSVTEWQQFYKTAMLQGDRIAVRCLLQEFQTRFHKPLPVEELK